LNDHEFIQFVFEQFKQMKLDGENPDLAHLIPAVSAQKASDWDSIAIKLAIWRWVRIRGQGDAEREMSLSDRLIYSAFRDAVKLSGREELAAQADYDNDFYAELISSAA
jgi:regulation of enolase protein 1 (concanavalin A-like superfamily)|tara:strand:- start:150 stop:476 length:327 start_codon:yes stop_codon:yes gene_type:complete